MTKSQFQAVRRLSAKLGLPICAVAFCFTYFAEDASAQGVVRRLGTRIRDAVQQRGPLLQPPAEPPAPAATTPATPATRPTGAQTLAPASRTSNYNQPQTRPGTAPTSRRPSNAATNPRPDNSVAKPSIDVSPRRSSAPAPTVAARARLGLIVETPAPTQVPGVGTRPTKGALVVGTEPGSGSEASGMLPGDLVVAIDGRTIGDVDDLVTRLGDLNPGDPVELKFIRDRKLSAVTSIMAGPDGKLNPEDQAALRSLAASDAKNQAANTNTDPASTPSAISGLGRALGGWLAGGTKAPATAAPQGNPTSDAVQPLEGGVVQIDFESPGAMGEAEALGANAENGAIAQPPVGLIDPPSLGQSLADETMELLPPPAIADVTEAFPANLAGDENGMQPPSSVEQSTIQSLLKELELLRKRVEQLEAEKANPPKS